MKKRRIPQNALLLLIASVLLAWTDAGPRQPSGAYGFMLPSSTDKVRLWWASSGWKIGKHWSEPDRKAGAVRIRAARNEAEAAQLVIRPSVTMKGFSAEATKLTGPGRAEIPGENVEVLRVRYVFVEHPTDASSTKGFWPDPLPPFRGSIELEENQNHPLWVRITVPGNQKAGLYQGRVLLRAEGYADSVDLEVEVYDFTLPERMTCTTGFGFSPHNVWRYQNLREERHKREVLDKYWANFRAHRISPYEPAPLDEIRDDWPDVKSIPPKWEGGRRVGNEKFEGMSALLVMDDRKDSVTQASYRPFIPVPKGGFTLSFWYRTFVPDHRFLVSLNHYDENAKWMWGKNNDIVIKGNGFWQKFEKDITRFPEGAKFVKLRLMGTQWTEEGLDTGLVWYDGLTLRSITSGIDLVEGGGFEPMRLFESVDKDRLEPKLDFTSWDRAMERAMDFFHFNSFRLFIPGMGGGTFHATYEPMLLGYTDDCPEYFVAFNSYCRQLEDHLRKKGWLDFAYVYWFDEPSPDQYPFVTRGFEKLKKAAPGIGRMLTEQVEPGLVGGPNIWCSITNHYDHERARKRRKHGEKFWWYVCTGPKAPFAGLFIDHAGTEMRVWLWQTFKRRIDGALVWQTNYWTSPCAYPDPERPQNPYEDPMGWVSGYSTPAGVRRAWGNGDGRFIYPPEAAADGRIEEPILEGPVDSIRWEMLRDGVEDYEYLVILEKLSKGKSDLLEVPPSITRDLKTFTKDPAPIEERRHEIARAIVRLGGR